MTNVERLNERLKAMKVNRFHCTTEPGVSEEEWAGEILLSLDRLAAGEFEEIARIGY